MSEVERLRLSPGLKHWRNWCPPAYYCSHALAPLMHITDTVPVKVNALAMTEPAVQSPRSVRVADPGAVILARMDNGAVFRLFGLMLSSTHRTRYELHGERGLMGTSEPNHWACVRIAHEPWLRREGQPHEQTYKPDWPAHGELARRSGHGGGDFWTNFHFARAIRSGTPPYLDVYRGVAMCNVGILAWRSALQDGAPIQVPDFRKEAVRKQYEHDHWSPWPDGSGDGKATPSIHGYRKPGAKALATARKAWATMGYSAD